jgi:hypothetical protein
MKLHEIVSARYNCSFPAKLNKPAIEYYKNHSQGTRCLFIFEMMESLNDYTLHRDELRYMVEEAPEVWVELFEAYLYAAYEDVKKNGKKPKNLVIVLDDES